MRPIAIGEIWYKVAAQYLLRGIACPFNEGSTQYGAGRRGGAERAAHVIQAALEGGGSDAIAICCDFQNAFNTRNRNVIMRSVFACRAVRSIHRLFGWAYDSPSALLAYDMLLLKQALQSANGVRQGDTLASLAFALSMEDPYRKAIIASKNRVTGVSVLDDLTIVGPPEDAGRAYLELERLASRYGMKLQRDKGKVLWPHASAVPSAVLDLKLPVVTGATMILGVMIGLDEKATSARLVAELDSERKMLGLLGHASMPKQVALLMLRSCAAPRFGYTTRTHPPEVTKDAVKEFDAMIEQTLTTVLNLPSPLPSNTRAQISLPIRLGGLGLQPHARTAGPAYLSAVLAALPDIKATHKKQQATLRPRSAPKPLLDCPQMKHVTTTHAALLAQGVTSEDLPKTAELLLARHSAKPASRLQHAITKQLAQHVQKRLLTPAPPRSGKAEKLSRMAVAARLLSASGAGASAWLTCLPSSRETRLSDDDFPLVVRHLLGLPPSEAITSLTCTCGEALAGHPDHFQWCKKFGKAAHYRHDTVVQRLAQLSRATDNRTHVEPYSLQKEHSARPDMSISNASGTALVDVAVSHPGSPSFLPRAKTQGGVAAIREAAKIAKYKDMATAEKAVFHAFVLESHGLLSPGATNFLKVLSRQAASQHISTAPAFLKNARSTISIALQIGNARIAKQGIMDLRAGLGSSSRRVD